MRRDASGSRAPAGRQCFLVARCSAKSSRTDALIAVDAVDARSAVFAGRRTALVDVDAAILASESGPTFAAVIVVQIRTRSTVGARLGKTQVHYVFAQGSDKAGNALAPKLVHHVNAGSSVDARIPLAVVDVDFTSGSAVSVGTLTAERVTLVRTHATVLTRAWIALVDLHLTGSATVASGTLAFKPQQSIPARSVQTRLLGARYGLLLAVSSDPTVGAIAPVAMLFVVTHAVVQARLSCTVADHRLAVGAGESGRALAGVRALASVEAGAAILARLVVRAKVQVLVAKQTTPSFVTQTLPRFLAGSVHASRIRFTLVAQLSLPSGLTNAFIWLVAVAVLFVTSGSAARGRTVVSLPAGEAHPFAVRGASVVAKLVVTFPTQVGTSRTVVR